MALASLELNPKQQCRCPLIAYCISVEKSANTNNGTQAEIHSRTGSLRRSCGEAPGGDIFTNPMCQFRSCAFSIG